jgi:hypothetical protein
MEKKKLGEKENLVRKNCDFLLTPTHFGDTIERKYIHLIIKN